LLCGFCEVFREELREVLLSTLVSCFISVLGDSSFLPYADAPCFAEVAEVFGVRKGLVCLFGVMGAVAR
jgi:hypothetical protein